MAEDLKRTTAIERKRYKQPGIMPGIEGQPGLYPPGGEEGGTGVGLKRGGMSNAFSPEYEGKDRRKKKGRRKGE